jgi:hypothetical protein
LSSRYWLMMGRSWAMPVFMRSLSKVSGSGRRGSKGLVLRLDRSSSCISDYSIVHSTTLYI